MTTSPSTLRWVIPAGTPERTCRSCGYQCWWVKLPSGKLIPVDARAEGCEAPGRQTSGLGVAHWASCPRATDHHRRAAAQAHIPVPAECAPAVSRSGLAPDDPDTVREIRRGLPREATDPFEGGVPPRRVHPPTGDAS